MALFQIFESEGLRRIKATLEDEIIYVEPGALSYMLGEITVNEHKSTAEGWFKSLGNEERVYKPAYKGSGVVWLEASFASFYIMTLLEEGWIFQPNAFLAAEGSVRLEEHREKMLATLLSGKGLLSAQTKAQGSGQVVLLANGPIEAIKLTGNKLIVNSKTVIGYSGNIEHGVERASKAAFKSMNPMDLIVHSYSGHGTVLLAPIPNWQNYLQVKLEQFLKQQPKKK